MEKRLILAIALALLVLLAWSTLVSRFYPTVPQPVRETPSSRVISTPSETPKPLDLGIEPIPEESALIKFSQEKIDINFLESLAAIKEVTFKDYGNYKFPLKWGLLLKDKNLSFKKESTQDSESAVFVSSDIDKRITKRFIFTKTNYRLELDIKIENLSSAPLKIALPLVLGVLNFSRDNPQARFQDVTLALKDKVSHLNAHKDTNFQEVEFLGLRDRYFCAIIEPEAKHFSGFIKRINAQESEIGLILDELLLSPNQEANQKFHIYLGPQELRTINNIKPAWSAVVHYGVFDFVSQLLLQLLEAVYRLVHNWGGAIIILSLIIYLLLFPLSLKQMRSMKQMQALQPRIEELRKTYKDNPQRLNKEIMQLYREHRANPLSGCLPLILQMPIFFALYQALIRSVALKGAKFLWIKDLSEPDRLFILPTSLPVLGNEINILPILMAIGMFVQQKISTAAVPSASGSEQQKLMTIIFPFMFGFIFYHMPSGLVLYWFVNSLLMLIHQFRISRAK